MTATSRPLRITSQALAEALHEAGIIPDPVDLARVIIDMKSGHAAIIYYEQFADERLLGVIRTTSGLELAGT